MEKRDQIIALHKEKCSEREIARRLHIPPSTVHYWIAKLGNTTPQSGRSRVITSEQDVALFQAMAPMKTVADLQKELALTCSRDTVRRHLREQGYYKGTRKPLLTPHDCQERLKFATSHKHWSWENWKRVVFTSKHYFYLPCLRVGPESPRVHVRIMFGGSIRHCFEDDTIPPSIECTLEKENLILMRDCGTLYRHNIPVLEDWPSNDMDLNPVENIWFELERLVKLKRGGETREQLWEDIVQAFDFLPHEYFESLVHSLPTRIKLVISKQGAY